MTDRPLSLLQNTNGPLIACCPCGAPDVLGEYVVALVLDDGAHRLLCARCSRQASPDLAVCVEALNTLAVTACGLSSEHGLRLLCALVEQVARLAGPTVAFMNVNPNLIERINNP